MKQVIFPYLLITRDPEIQLTIPTVSVDGSYFSALAPNDNLHSFLSTLPFEEIYHALQENFKKGEGFALLQISDHQYSTSNGSLAALISHID